MKQTQQSAMKPVELKKLRERAGLTPTDLGAKIGVSARTIDRWEAGQVRITRLHRTAIMAALGYTEPLSA